MSEPLEPRPVVRALKDENKIGAIGGLIAIDRRQLWVMIVLLFACFALWGALNPIFDLNAIQNLLIFGPLILIVMVASFYKYDGRYLDFWGRKAVSRSLKPTRFRWRKRPPGAPRHVRDAVQSIIPADKIYWQMLRTIDGTYVMIFELEMLSLSLASEEQKARVEKAAQALYNRASTFPYQELMIGKGRDTKLLARRLQEDIRKNIAPDEKSRLAYGKQKCEFYNEIGAKYGAQERTGYLVIPYRPANPVKGVSQVAFVTETHARALQHEAQEAYSQIRINASIFRDGYKPMGIALQPLIRDKLVSFVKEQASGDLRPEQIVDIMPQAKSDIAQIKFGAYEKVNEKKLAKMVKAQRELRKDEPPAVGIGDLQLVDRISPDALDIRDDAIRVGDKWRQGLLLYDLPDEITFGVLTRLTNWQNPLKLTKHIRPVPRNTAIHQLGGKLAELKASKKSADRGDVVENEQRDQSHGSAKWALLRLLQGKENLFKVSLYAELEHENMRTLKAMMKELEAEFAASQITTKTCRQEAWESYITNLPLGKDLCDPNYAQVGLMTDALAALFSYGSQQINHPNGILMGLDRESSSLVVLDTLKLNNPHILWIGDTGAGKTFSLKEYTTNLNLRGDRVVVIDPIGNSKYGRVAQAMNGEFIELRPGTEDHINPCDLRGGYMNLSYFSGDIDDFGHEEELMLKAKEAALAGKKDVLTTMVSLMATNQASKGLTPEESGRTERIWGEVYASKGITNDPETHSNEPPTFHNFFLRLHELKEDDGIVQGLLSKLYTWDTVEGGSMSEYLKYQTNVDLSSRYLVVRVSDLPGRAKRPMEFALLDFLVPILSNPEEPAAVDFEELWDILNSDPDDPIAKFVEEFCRSGRARRCALLAASQHPSEFLNSRIGQVLLDQAETKMILKIKGGALNLIKDLYGMSREEAERIKHAAQGEGTLILGDDIQIPIKGLASEYEQELFNTTPALEERYAAKRRSREEALKKAADGINDPERLEVEPPAPRNGSRAGSRLRTLLDTDHAKPPVHDTPDTPEQSAPMAMNPGEARSHVQPEPSGVEPAAASAGPARAEAPQVASGGTADSGLLEHREGPVTIEEAEEIKEIEQVEAIKEVVEINEADEVEVDTTGVSGTAEDMVSDLVLGEAAYENARVYAFVGPEAHRTAYHAAGLLAKANEGRNVLLVDAHGSITDEIWPKNPDYETVPPDEFIYTGLKRKLESYLAVNHALGLHIMFSANDPRSLPADGIAKHTRQKYSAIVVACSNTNYAREWLIQADRVAASASDARELKKSIQEAESIRGSNGTLAAPLGDVTLPPAMGHHPVIRLPGKDETAYAHAEQNYDFATLSDPAAAEAFSLLMSNLLLSPKGNDAQTNRPNPDVNNQTEKEMAP